MSAERTNRPDVPAPKAAKKQRPQKGAAGADRIPRRQNNGFYADHSTGERLRSVTTIIGQGVPKEALTYWAANTVAACAIDNLPYLVKASRSRTDRDEAYAWLTRAHTRKKDERADVGSAVHKLIEAHLLLEPVPSEVVDDPEIAPFLDHFLRFVDDWAVEFTASEMVVANYTDCYAGTLDFMLRSPRLIAALRGRGYDAVDDVDLMGDTKTGGELDRLTSAGHHHGVYPEAGMQMSAYRRGEQCWLRDGSKVDMPATANVGVVLHLRPEGYRIYPVACGDAVYAYFRHAQVVAEWTSRVASAKADRPVVGDALAIPAATAATTKGAA